MGKKSSNPADAYRKQLRKKELKKNKESRQKVREVATVRKDTKGIEAEIRKLEQQDRKAALSKAEKQDLEDLRLELKRVKETKEKYLEAHPEHRKYVAGYEDKPETKDGGRKEEAQSTSASTSNGRIPERSVYYHPIFNPLGAPPPGMPYLEKAPDQWGAPPTDDGGSDAGPSHLMTQGAAGSPAADDDNEEEESSDDSDEDDDDILMPEGPAPTQDGEESDISDILMPEGPPPPLPGQPPLPLEPPPITNAQISLPPPPPAGPAGFATPYAQGPHPHFYPTPLLGFAPHQMQMGVLPGHQYHPHPPPPPMRGAPVGQRGVSHRGFNGGPGRPSPRPLYDPLAADGGAHTTYQAHRAQRSHQAGLPHGGVSDNGWSGAGPAVPVAPGPPPGPPPSAVVAAVAPQLRDLKKEATSFVPPALRKKQAAEKARAQMGLPVATKIDAAPEASTTHSADNTHAAPEDDERVAAKPDLFAALGKHLNTAPSAKDSKKSDYEGFLASVGDLL